MARLPTGIRGFGLCSDGGKVPYPNLQMEAIMEGKQYLLPFVLGLKFWLGPSLLGFEVLPQMEAIMEAMEAILASIRLGFEVWARCGRPKGVHWRRPEGASVEDAPKRRSFLYIFSSFPLTPEPSLGLQGPKLRTLDQCWAAGSKGPILGSGAPNLES